MKDTTMTIHHDAPLHDDTRDALMDLGRVAADALDNDDEFAFCAGDLSDDDWGSRPIQSRVNAAAALRRALRRSSR